MNISGLQYNLNRKTLEIYVSGCYGQCRGCHNQELWDFNVGKDYNLWKEKIKKRIGTGLINEIWILGGDPLDQDKDELIDLINYIKNVDSDINIWVWTRYSIESVDKSILEKIQYLKTGPYIEDGIPYVDELTGVKLASLNQIIIKI